MRDQSFLPHAHLFDLGCFHPAAVLLISVATWEAHGNDLSRGAHSLNLSGPFKVSLKKKEKKNLKLLNGDYESILNERRRLCLAFSVLTCEEWRNALASNMHEVVGGNTLILFNFYPLLWTSSSPHVMQKSELSNAGCGLRLVPKIKHCRSRSESLLVLACQIFRSAPAYLRSPSLRRTHDMRVCVTIFKYTSRYDWNG